MIMAFIVGVAAGMVLLGLLLAAVEDLYKKTHDKEK